jgi:ketosteroid isomerase-like protein
MAADDAQVVRELFEALAEGGVEAMLPFVHPEGEMITPPELAAEPDTYRGHEGMRRYFESFYDVMDRVTVDLDRVENVAEGQVVAAVKLRTRGRITGIESGLDVQMLCGVADGKVSLIRFYPTREEAVAAALAESG